MPFSETIAVYTENHTVRTVHDTFQHSYHLAPGRSCMTQRQMLKDFLDTSHVLLHKYSPEELLSQVLTTFLSVYPPLIAIRYRGSAS
jgi:hypothetical protein